MGDLDPLAALGWGDDLAAALPAGHEPLRVARVDRGAVDAFGSDGVRRRLQLDPLHPLPLPPTTGDWVAVVPGTDLVVATLPRRTALVRADAHDEGKPQVLAADVDLVGICASLGAPLHGRRVERYVTLAWSSGAEPLVVLTKADAATDRALAEARRRVADHAPGVDVVVCSTRDRRGVDELRARLVGGRTLVLVGPSGVGKSSLVNLLVDREAMAIGDVRAGDQKGRHTTATRELVPLPGGGALLDTPGLRSLVPWDDGRGLERAFPEVVELLGTCRFADCGHAGEPGCSLRVAVQEGAVRPERLEGWRRLQEDLARIEAEAAARAAAPRQGRRPRR